jgi:general secretion pathway protein G
MKSKTLVKGFTLIELMVVILILAILAALVVPRLIGKAGEAKQSKAKADLATLAGLINNFRLDCDRYPSTEEGLNALRTPPADVASKWHGPYTDQDISVDPWGNAYHYQYPGQNGPDTFDLYSYGADNQPGGTGENADIWNGAN